MSTKAPVLDGRDARRGAPELQVVRRRKRAKRGTPRRAAPAVVLAIVCAAVIVFGVLLEQVVLAQSAFKLARLRSELRAAEAEHEELLLHAARLSSSARIERLARGRLGMVDPGAIEYVTTSVRSRSALAGGAPRGSRVAAASGMAAPGAPRGGAP